MEPSLDQDSYIAMPEAMTQILKAETINAYVICKLKSDKYFQISSLLYTYDSLNICLASPAFEPVISCLVPQPGDTNHYAMTSTHHAAVNSMERRWQFM